jgi:CRISPR-associated protein Cas2
MPMTVLVARNASDRMRGFLASSMLELAPGVYAASHMSPAARMRVWEVVVDWSEADTSAICLWHEASAVGKLGLLVVGSPPIDLREVDGLILARRT